MKLAYVFALLAVFLTGITSPVTLSAAERADINARAFLGITTCF